MDAYELSGCGRGCYVIGGPWITCDPGCPTHGNAAQKRESEMEALWERCALAEKELKEVRELLAKSLARSK